MTGRRLGAKARYVRLGQALDPSQTGAISGLYLAAPLTEPQKAIVDLVRLGHTNRQIGAILFVSEKTVERRLSQIFASVGVSNRTALASMVAAP